MISSLVWSWMLTHVIVSGICLIGSLGMILRYGYRGFLLGCGLILLCLAWGPPMGASGGW